MTEGPLSMTCCDVLCFATAANAMGALIGGGAMTDCNCDTVAAADVVVVVVDAVADDAGGAGASEIGCIGFLFGVEHTIVLFSVDDELIE